MSSCFDHTNDDTRALITWCNAASTLFSAFVRCSFTTFLPILGLVAQAASTVATVVMAVPMLVWDHLVNLANSAQLFCQTISLLPTNRLHCLLAAPPWLSCPVSPPSAAPLCRSSSSVPLGRASACLCHGSQLQSHLEFYSVGSRENGL